MLCLQVGIELTENCELISDYITIITVNNTNKLIYCFCKYKLSLQPTKIIQHMGGFVLQNPTSWLPAWHGLYLVVTRFSSRYSCPHRCYNTSPYTSFISYSVPNKQIPDKK